MNAKENAETGSLTLEQKLGAFPGTWAIKVEGVGSPSLHLSLIFSTGDNSISGHAQVTQALESPIVLSAKVRGNFRRLGILGSPYFMIHGEGYPDLKWPAHGGIGPVLPPTLEFHLNTPTTISLGGKRQKVFGEGQFRYRANVTEDWGPWLEGTVEKVNALDQ